MHDLDRTEGSPSVLARKALAISSTLALAGAGIGLIAILNGAVVGEEMVLVLSGGVVSVCVLVASLAFPRLPAQPVAAAATVFYTVYLCAGIFISVLDTADHQSLFIYLVWFFPLLVFNRLVNSLTVGRGLAKIILLAPLLILCGISARLALLLTPGACATFGSKRDPPVAR